MAVTAPEIEPEVEGFRPRKMKRNPVTCCSFCIHGNHEFCPRMIIWFGKRWKCTCDDPDCKAQVVWCVTCKLEEEGAVSPSEWRCYDRDACDARVEARLAANPLVQKIRASRSRAMAETAEKAEKAKAEKAAKEPTFCLVTGEATKGGKFKPGMDAKYVSLRVAEVMVGKATEAVTLKRFDEEVGSDALKAKFVKSLGLAREREEKKAAAAKAKAEGKDAEKATEAPEAAAKPAAKKAASGRKA